MKRHDHTDLPQNLISRRSFLGTAGAATALTLSSGLNAAECCSKATSCCAAAKKCSFKGSDIVPLGKTGIQVSRLAQGTGFNGGKKTSAHTRMGAEKFNHLLHHSLDQGVNFLDMADLYGSHPFVKNAVKGLPRDKYVMLSKIWPREESWNKPSGGAIAELDRYRQELGVDQIEVCLIHCMTNAQWPTTYERIRDELSELKEKQVIRATGVSCHDFQALKVAAEHPWVDVIFARINHMGGKKFFCDAPAKAVASVLKTARQNGKAVVGMKIFGAGKLVKPDEKDASLKYVFSNGLVDAITVGMLKTNEVDDTLERMAKIA